MKKNYDLVKNVHCEDLYSYEEMFIEIRLYNPMTYYFKGHVKIVEKYMVKFNLSVFNRLKTNVILNKTVTKLFTILTKCFFPYLNPTSYLNMLLRVFFHLVE